MTQAIADPTVLQYWGLNLVKPTIPKRIPKEKTTNDELICGVELEIENLLDSVHHYRELTESYFDVVEDGSLRPRGQAWEFVSKPMPLAKLLPTVEWLFEELSIKETNYSDRCSIHLHVNVQDMTRSQLSTLALAYSVLEDVIFHFVNEYQKVEEQGYCRDSNIYCVPWNQCRISHRLVDDLFGMQNKIRDWNKYTALNFLPVAEKGTIEWRHMHGTCNMEKIRIWFNLIGALVDFAKSTDFEDMLTTVKTLNDSSAYQQFFNSVTKGTLPYDPNYAKLLSDGVVNAKYCLNQFRIVKEKMDVPDPFPQAELLQVAPRPRLADMLRAYNPREMYDIPVPVPVETVQVLAEQLLNVNVREVE